MVRLGELKHRCDVLEKTEVSESGAPMAGDWTPVYESVWARIGPLRGSTRTDYGYEQDQAVTEITIRHKDGISNRMRVKVKADSGTVSYDIGHVEDAWADRPRRFLKLICTRAEDTE